MTEQFNKESKTAHLERPVHCNACQWNGVNGQLIFRNERNEALCCPTCDSGNIHYLRPEGTETVQ